MTDEQVENSPPAKAKRMRVSLICACCRERKLRCDRQRPFCGRCILDNCTDKCQYVRNNVPVQLNEMMDTMEVAKLSTRIKELEEIVKYQRTMLSQYAETLKKPAMLTPSTTESGYSSDTSSSVPTTRTAFDGYVIITSNLVYLEPTSAIATLMEDPELVKMFSQIYYDSQNMRCNPEADVTKSLHIGKLPPIKDVDIILNAFFDMWSPFIAFLEKDEILSQLHHLLKDDGANSTVDVSSSKSSSLIAILLIMLRFAYISLPKNPSFAQIMDATVIDESYIDCAAGMLMAPLSFRNTKAEKIKGLLLLRIYKMFCPEDDDTTYAVSMINSVLVQSSRFMGLTQDPSTFPKAFLTENELRCWKEMRGAILYLDTTHAFDKGISPSTHLSEVHDKQSMCEDKVSRAMESISMDLRIFMGGALSHRSIDRAELTTIEKSLSELLARELRTFEQLVVPSPKASLREVSEKAREFIFRLDMTYKDSLIKFLMHLHGPPIDKEKHLAQAFERTMVLLRVFHQIAVEKRSFFGPEFDKMIFQRASIAPRFFAFLILKIGDGVLGGHLSLFTYLKAFDSPDSPGLLNWMGVDFSNEEQSMINVLLLVNDICGEASKLSARNYSCFKASLFNKLGLNLLCTKYPSLKASVGSHGGWQNPIPPEQIAETWRNRHEQNAYFTVESLFAGLENNLYDDIEAFGNTDWMQQFQS